MAGITECGIMMPAVVRDLLNRHGLPGEALVLEVTETSIIANLEKLNASSTN